MHCRKQKISKDVILFPISCRICRDPATVVMADMIITYSICGVYGYEVKNIMEENVHSYLGR